MLHHVTYVTLVTVMVILILLMWKIGFGVTGVELVGVMPTVQGFVWCDAGRSDLLTYVRIGSWSDYP
jgi:hypothetical protein